MRYASLILLTVGDPVRYRVLLQVTLPQLSLLETALSSMPRIEVFVMRRQSRSPGDVFEVGVRRDPDGDGFQTPRPLVWKLLSNTPLL